MNATSLPVEGEETRPLPPGMVGRSMAARIVGCTLNAFKSREKAGRYQAAGIDDKGCRYYDRAYLQRCRNDLAVVRPNDPRLKDPVEPAAPAAPPPFRGTSNRTYDPETAKAIFHELAIDEDLVRVVEVLSLHPEVVRAVSRLVRNS